MDQGKLIVMPLVCLNHPNPMPLPILQVDAFSDQPLRGNPCAVVFESDNLSAEVMQQVALEMNLSETAFVMQSNQADFKVRYFTPAEEIPMAGHPTIATTHALVETGRVKLTDPCTIITLEMQVGPIRVEIFSRQNRIQRIVMTQQKPAFLNTYEAADVMPVFNLTPADLLPGASIQTVSTGTPQLMVPLKNHDALKRARVDIDAYVRLRGTSDFFSPHLFCLSGVTEQGQTFARHFGTPPDTFEDPFTGSATGGMAAYLWRYGLIDNAAFIAEQGHWMGRPGQAFVKVVGAREDIEAVKVGGTAVTILDGRLLL